MIMEYNNYYPRQSGHPHSVGMMEQHPMGPNNSGMMQGGPPPPPLGLPPPPLHQAARQTINLGPIQQAPMQNQQQMTPLSQQMGHHIQPMTPQPQQQPPPQSNYHQMTPHPPLSHSASPHPPTPHSLSHTPTLNQTQPPPRPSTGPSPQHPPSHHQSPIHMNGPPPQPLPHMQQPPPNHHMMGQPPPNQILPPGVSPSPQPMMHPPPQNQGFMGPGGPMPPHASPHYNGPPPPPPPNHHHPHHHHHHHPHHHQPPPPPPNIAPPPHMPPMHHHGPPPQPPPNFMTHMHPGMERNSPYNMLHIPQTEFRIIEFNKRLQNRPRPRGPASPLPLIGSADESIWWERFVGDFFDDDSTLTLRVPADDRPTEYTIGRTLIPKFFRSYFEGGVVDLSIKLRNTREIAHNNSIILECEQTDITTKNVFRHPATNITMNVVVHTEGHLSIDFVSNSFDSLLIKSWRFYTHQCHEYIDRSITTNGLPNAFLIEPVTRNGLTKSTIAYLKMCMIMEPMQVLMLQHQQTALDPRTCLKNLLHVKYKYKSVEDNRAQPKRRKRKAPGTAGPTGQTKKTKANTANINAMSENNGIGGFNNNLMSPANVGGAPNLSLASQDVLVVGEPSMLGADFGDENERRITRLENSQFDVSVSNNQNNQNQACDNLNEQTQPQTNSNNNNNTNNNATHMQQPNNHDNPGLQMMNMPNNQSTLNNNGSNSNSSNNTVNAHPGGINNNNNNNSNINNNNNSSNQSNDSTLSLSNNVNNCIQGNNNDNNSNNNITMNSISMNGNVNHITHIKTEMDMKQQQSVAVTTATTVTSPADVESQAR